MYMDSSNLSLGLIESKEFPILKHRVEYTPLPQLLQYCQRVDEIDQIAINPSDLRIDTYRASGAGGQHINKTDSAVRITHIPSGTVSECQDGRSQHKNKAQAMSMLHSRLLMHEQEQRKKDTAEERKNLIGSGDRSERIRTYNFPQGRITDHRINLTLYKLDHILEGNIEPLIDELKKASLN